MTGMIILGLDSMAEATFSLYQTAVVSLWHCQDHALYRSDYMVEQIIITLVDVMLAAATAATAAAAAATTPPLPLLCKCHCCMLSLISSLWIRLSTNRNTSYSISWRNGDFFSSMPLHRQLWFL